MTLKRLKAQGSMYKKIEHLNIEQGVVVLI